MIFEVYQADVTVDDVVVPMPKSQLPAGSGRLPTRALHEFFQGGRIGREIMDATSGHLFPGVTQNSFTSLAEGQKGAVRVRRKDQIFGIAKNRFEVPAQSRSGVPGVLWDLFSVLPGGCYSTP